MPITMSDHPADSPQNSIRTIRRPRPASGSRASPIRSGKGGTGPQGFALIVRVRRRRILASTVGQPRPTLHSLLLRFWLRYQWASSLLRRPTRLSGLPATDLLNHLAHPRLARRHCLRQHPWRVPSYSNASVLQALLVRHQSRWPPSACADMYPCTAVPAGRRFATSMNGLREAPPVGGAGGSVWCGLSR